jgi:hypothetical protein
MEHPKWCPEHENILSEWADKALCYKWLHTKSYEKYQRLYNLYTVPLIVMSTLTGTANFAQDKLPPNIQFYAPIIIGCINIISGIIATVQQFFHINELNEGHRVSMISWDKFYRRIKNELSKNPKERSNVNEFIMSSTEDYERITETSPILDKDMIHLFKETFDGTLTSNDTKQLYQEITKPEILDNLISVKKSVYKNPTPTVELVKPKEEFVIEMFSKKFSQEFGRIPTREELVDNLTNETLREEHIDRYIYNYQNEDV